LTRGDVIEIGFSFGKLKRRHYLAIGDLMYGDVKDISSFREGRRRRHGILHGVAKFFAWGFAGPSRGFGLLVSDWLASRAAKAAKSGDSGGGPAIEAPAAGGFVEAPPARAAAG
jgi:hypothetical protein